MPPDNRDVTQSDSLSDKSQTTPSHEGKSALSQSGDEMLANLKEENKRKAQEIADLHSKLNAVQSNLEQRIEELQEKSRLSSNETQELETMQEQVAAIKRDKRSAPWFSINKEIATTEAEKSAIAHTSRLADDLAYLEIERFAEQEKKTVSEIEKEIVHYMKLVDPAGDMTPVRRAREGYKRMKEDQEYQKRKDELKQKEEQYAEGVGRGTAPISTGLKSDIEKASKSGNFTDVLSKVYEKHALRP